MERVLRSERREEDIFATLAMVTIALATEEVTVRLAGHPPPLLLRGGAVTTVASRPGAVLGIFDDAQWPAVTSELGSDWALLLYTDGLIEGRLDGGVPQDHPDRSRDGGANSGPSGRRLGVKGLRELLDAASAAGVPQARLPDWLHEQARHRHGSDLEDDVAMLLLTTCVDGTAPEDVPA
jgi:serine phosphatase RsbU (regulator of sigma subunit)